MASDTENIKERLSIVDVLGAYLKMERSGGSFKARCPFHNEKTPSFFISPERNTYYCFGCGAKGDIFTFVEQFEGIDFPGALKMLAEQAGITLSSTRTNTEGAETKALLHEILEAACLFFERQYRERVSDVGEYLRSRGIAPETAQKFRLGYAPTTWEALREHLEGRGYKAADIVRAGLIKPSPKRPDSYYDVFRNRITFPIADSTGRIIAFSGRIYGAHDEKTPKYLNSPDTPLFTKSKVLYGFDRAKQAIRKYNFSIVVEGQMDLVMSHQGGFPNTVAVSGTALTREHLTLLNRLSSNVLLAYDADAAGISSTGRAAKEALALGMDVKIAVLPRGVDPADLIKEDPEKWREAVRHAVHIIPFYLGLIQAEESDNRKQALRVSREVLPFVRVVQNAVDRAVFIRTLARALNIAEEALAEEVRRGAERPAASPNDGKKEARQASERGNRKERLAASLMGILWWQERSAQPTLDPQVFHGKLSDILGRDAEEVSTRFQGREEELAFDAERMYGDRQSELSNIAEGILESIESIRLEESKKELSKLIAEAEKQNDVEKTEALKKEYQHIIEKARVPK